LLLPASPRSADHPAQPSFPTRRSSDLASYTVATVDAKPARRNPQAPFTTSTLQQEASRKLGFAPAHTMRIAQRLYEGIDIGGETDRKSTRLNSSHVKISYAVFCLKKKK